MQILFPTFFKTCAEDALSRPKASSASLDERGRFEERSRFENAIDSKGGAGFDRHNWLEERSRLRQTELARRTESAPRSRADSKNGVGFDERSPLQRAGSARGARLVSGQCLLQRAKPALARKANTSEPLPCTGMSRRAGQNKRQTSYSPAFSLWRMRMIETA